VSSTKINSYVLLVLTTFFWGTSWVLGKVLVEHAPPMTIGFFRFLIAILFFIPALIYYSDLKFSKKTILHFFNLGLIGVFGYGILFLVGIKLTTAAQGAIIAGFNPIGISFFAHIFHKERLDQRWKYIGFVISFTGVIFVIGVQPLINYEQDHLIGNLIILLAMGTWGIYTVYGKEVMKDVSSLEATSGAVFFGALFFGGGAIYEHFWELEAMKEWEFWAMTAALGFFVTFLGYLFYFKAIKNIGATSSSIFINLVPIFGTFFSYIYLGETIYWTFIVGLICIISGIVIINYDRIKE
jgi:drug/metabolite transporter (DMT)-like permease